jgi:hypothetical protein
MVLVAVAVELIRVCVRLLPAVMAAVAVLVCVLLVVHELISV